MRLLALRSRLTHPLQDTSRTIAFDSSLPREFLRAPFRAEWLGRSPARFDFAKLEHVNGHYMRQSADADLLATFLQRYMAGSVSDLQGGLAGVAKQIDDQSQLG